MVAMLGYGINLCQSTMYEFVMVNNILHESTVIHAHTINRIKPLAFLKCHPQMQQVFHF